MFMIMLLYSIQPKTYYGYLAIINKINNNTLLSSVPPGGTLDFGSTSSQYWVCGGAIQEVPISTRGATQLPEDRTEPGDQERGSDFYSCH